MDQINFTQNLTLQKIQEMEERRIVRIGESMKTYAEVDRQVIPIIGKCLDGIVKAAESIDQKNVSIVVATRFPTICGPIISPPSNVVTSFVLSSCDRALLSGIRSAFQL